MDPPPKSKDMVVFRILGWTKTWRNHWVSIIFSDQVMVRGCLQAGLVDKAVAVVRCAYHLSLGQSWNMVVSADGHEGSSHFLFNLVRTQSIHAQWMKHQCRDTHVCCTYLYTVYIITLMNLHIYPLYIETHTILSTTSHPKVAYLLTTRKLKTFPISLPIFEAGTWSLWNRWIVPRCWEIPVGFGDHRERQNRSTVHTLMYGRSHRNTMKTKWNVFVRCLLTIFLTKEKSRSTMFRKKYTHQSFRFVSTHLWNKNPPNLYQKAKEGLLFGLGELPFGCAFLAKMNRRLKPHALMKSSSPWT